MPDSAPPYAMITDPDEYFRLGCGRCKHFRTPACSVQTWSDGLAELRRVCLEAGLTETAKWGHPCYMLQGRNIVLLGAFRTDFRITFFNAALMRDPARLLEKPGPNSQTKSVIRFSDFDDLQAKAARVADYLDEAITYARAGDMPDKQRIELELPDDLTDALDSDPEYAEAFQALTPGRQRSYVIQIASAKKPETRRNRVARFRDAVLAGKGANER